MSLEEQGLTMGSRVDLGLDDDASRRITVFGQFLCRALSSEEKREVRAMEFRR